MGKARGQWEWGFVLLLVASYGVSKVAIQASVAQDLWLRGWPRAVTFLALGLLHAVLVAATRQSVQDLAATSRVSIVVPARYEQDYIVRTLAYTFDTTESELLHEVIVVDDMSDVPVLPMIE